MHIFMIRKRRMNESVSGQHGQVIRRLMLVVSNSLKKYTGFNQDYVVRVLIWPIDCKY